MNDHVVASYSLDNGVLEARTRPTGTRGAILYFVVVIYPGHRTPLGERGSEYEAHVDAQTANALIAMAEAAHS